MCTINLVSFEIYILICVCLLLHLLAFLQWKLHRTGCLIYSLYSCKWCGCQVAVTFTWDVYSQYDITRCWTAHSWSRVLYVCTEAEDGNILAWTVITSQELQGIVVPCLALSSQTNRVHLQRNMGCPRPRVTRYSHWCSSSSENFLNQLYFPPSWVRWWDGGVNPAWSLCPMGTWASKYLQL